MKNIVKCHIKGDEYRLKTAFIVNSIAVGRCAAGWSRVKDHIKDNHSFSRDVRMTESCGQAVHLTRDAVRSGYEMVVAVGGDGTVNEVLNGLFQNGSVFHQNLVLGIIPLGSGCDTIRSLNIPKEPTGAIKAVEGNGTRRVDVGRVEFINLRGERESRLFINIADLGAGGLVVQKASQAPRILGQRPNYVWGILTAALKYKARTVNLSIDGDGPLILAVRNTIIANGRYFGRGFHAAPQAKMDDGLFDIVNVGDFGIMESLWHVPKLYRGTHLGLEKVDHFRGRKVEVSADEEVLLEMDGELVGTLPAAFEIMPSAINIAAS